MTHDIYYPINEEIYYDTALTQMEAIRNLTQYKGKLFDPDYVEKFIKFIIEFE